MTPPPDSLELSPAEMRAATERALDLLVEATARLEERPASPPR
jgi:hypothetical protein